MCPGLPDVPGDQVLPRPPHSPRHQLLVTGLTVQTLPHRPRKTSEAVKITRTGIQIGPCFNLKILMSMTGLCCGLNYLFSVGVIFYELQRMTLLQTPAAADVGDDL